MLIFRGIAASAPLFLSEKLCELHDKVLRSVFTLDHPHCAELIRESWSSINNVTSTGEQINNNGFKQIFRGIK